MEAIDGISKSFLALLARQLAQEKEEQEEQEEQEKEEKDQEEGEMPSLQSKMEELVAINQSLLEALDLSHPVLQQVQIGFKLLSHKNRVAYADINIFPLATNATFVNPTTGQPK